MGQGKGVAVAKAVGMKEEQNYITRKGEKAGDTSYGGAGDGRRGQVMKVRRHGVAAEARVVHHRELPALNPI